MAEEQQGSVDRKPELTQVGWNEAGEVPKWHYVVPEYPEGYAELIANEGLGKVFVRVENVWGQAVRQHYPTRSLQGRRGRVCQGWVVGTLVPDGLAFAMELMEAAWGKR